MERAKMAFDYDDEKPEMNLLAMIIDQGKTIILEKRAIETPDAQDSQGSSNMLESLQFTMCMILYTMCVLGAVYLLCAGYRVVVNLQRQRAVDHAFDSSKHSNFD